MYVKYVNRRSGVFLCMVDIAMYGALWYYNIGQSERSVGWLHDAFRAPKRRSRRA